jgi:broad specificity phosphatase PhoE
VVLLVVRHAHAGERSGWSGDDRLRPLSEKGLRQAGELADALAAHQPAIVLSSPAVRCISTVQPLADRVELEVQRDDRLFEGAIRDDVASLLRELAGRQAVICSHGDVIPLVLRQLVDDGMAPEQGLRWAKASTWIIEQTATGWGSGKYAPPPA